MEFDIRQMSNQDRYRLMTGAVIPRPIAWVTSMDKKGVINAAPFSFFNIMSVTPPVIGIGVDAFKDTVHNILETGEYVVNVVTDATALQMNITAIDFPHGEDELAMAGLHPKPSHRVRVPGISESPIQFECLYRDRLEIGQGDVNNYWIMGDIVHAHVNDEVWPDGRISYDLLRPLGRLSGSGYIKVDSTNFQKIQAIKLSEFQEPYG